jgi:hypothetical protein
MFRPSVTCQPCGDRLFFRSRFVPGCRLMKSPSSRNCPHRRLARSAFINPPIMHEFHNSHLPGSFNCVYIWVRRKNEAIPERLPFFLSLRHPDCSGHTRPMPGSAGSTRPHHSPSFRTEEWHEMKQPHFSHCSPVQRSATLHPDTACPFRLAAVSSCTLALAVVQVWLHVSAGVRRRSVPHPVWPGGST